MEKTIADLRADQQDWRKGVALIASALGEKDPPDLSCVRIADIALNLRADNEQLKAQLAEAEKLLHGLLSAMVLPALDAGRLNRISEVRGWLARAAMEKKP